MDNGGPAFPYVHPEFPGLSESGMSLRDWFAGQALAGLVSDPQLMAATGKVSAKRGLTDEEGMAVLAYELADAMLKARGRQAGQD